MEAVKLLVVREWRRMELHPRFWIGSLVLSLLLSTATPAMLLAHYVVVVTLLGALPLGLDNPATAVETLTLPPWIPSSARPLPTRRTGRRSSPRS